MTISQNATPTDMPAASATAPLCSGEDENDRLLNFYRQMLLIRRFEEALLAKFDAGALTGTAHTAIGQEAIAVACLAQLQSNDSVFSNHRCHAHFIAYGGDPRGLFLEILGDARGTCLGVGGSQHLHTGQFYSNGILGGMVPVATGSAFAKQIRANGGMSVCFLGDGAFGEGIVYEAMNMAALWRLPILFVVENNRYAQSTPIEMNLAGALALRPAAFGIATDAVQSNDVIELEHRFKRAFAHVRDGKGPYCQIVETYRLAPHSKGDDDRDPAEISAWWQRDPLLLARRNLDQNAVTSVELAVSAEIAAICTPPSDSRHLSAEALDPPGPQPVDGDSYVWRTRDSGSTMAAAMAAMFDRLMAKHGDMHLLGEDILDPYGGAFKIYKGLSSKFPDRVHTTPVSEAGITGIANGLALGGLRPVVEVMFGDFSTHIVDQLVNHAAKFTAMYGNNVACPTIVRSPMGGHRGYGPTHSQSLEKLFLGVPGLTVLATDALHDQEHLWERILTGNAPVLFIENKKLYASLLPEISDNQCGPFELTNDGCLFPVTRLSFRGTTHADATIVIYGGLLQLAMAAAEQLFIEHELIADIVLTTQISPCPTAPISELLRDPRLVAVVEEGFAGFGFGAELLAGLAQNGSLSGKQAIRIASRAAVIPGDATLEYEILPDTDTVVSEILRSLQ